MAQLNIKEKFCEKCCTKKIISEFTLMTSRGKTYYSHCKDCIRRMGREYYAKNPEYFRQKGRDKETRRRKFNPKKSLFTGLKNRAKKAGIPFNLDIDDLVIPEFCPVLGIRIKYGSEYIPDKDRDHSLSVDRIIPSLGYVRGNIILISFRANRIKNDATLEELQKIAGFYGKYLSKSIERGDKN